MAIYKACPQGQQCSFRGLLEKAKSNGLELPVDLWALAQTWAAWPCL